MNPRRVALVFVAAAAAAAAAQQRDWSKEPPVGGQAAEFPITAAMNMRATTHPMRSMRGRVVLLTCFQTRYDSCESAVDDINGIYDKYGPKGLTVLAYGEQDKNDVEPWIAKHNVRFPWVTIDTPTAEAFKRIWPAPGMPWSYLIDVDGKIVWQENPRNMQNPGVFKPGTMEPLLARTTAAPELPGALAEQQKLLDEGLWSAAKKSLDDAVSKGSLSKVDAGWAKETAAWIVRRHDAYLADADALCKKGWWWDAWDMMNDFPRRFEGMDGADKAKAKADEIRKTADAEKDLKVGDDVVKLRELVAKKNWIPVRLMFKRLTSEQKTSRWADRLSEIGEVIPPK